MIFGSIVLLVASGVLAALCYQTAGEWRDRRRFPPPGELIPLGGVLLHANIQGRGTPAVILEAGIAASSLSWTYVQPALASETTVVAYDRAGLGWSSSGSDPLSLPVLVEQLRELLLLKGIARPYVLVGHSFGGLLIRAFAHRYPADVAGLVFIDPVSIEAWAACTANNRRRLQVGARLSRRGARLARFGAVRFALAAAGFRGGWLAAKIARASAGKGTATLTRLVGEVRKLPVQLLPAIKAQWSNPKSFEAMARHLESLPDCAVAAAELVTPSHLPTLIFSAATATPAELAERDGWLTLHPKSRHEKVPNTGHWLHLEQPQLVIEAVRELLN